MRKEASDLDVELPDGCTDMPYLAALDAARTQFAHRAVHFLQRGRGIVHRQRGDETWKAGRMLRHQIHQSVVRHPRNLGRFRQSAQRFDRRPLAHRLADHDRPPGASPASLDGGPEASPSPGLTVFVCSGADCETLFPAVFCRACGRKEITVRPDWRGARA